MKRYILSATIEMYAMLYISGVTSISHKLNRISFFAGNCIAVNVLYMYTIYCTLYILYCICIPLQGDNLFEWNSTILVLYSNV